MSRISFDSNKATVNTVRQETLSPQLGRYVPLLKIVFKLLAALERCYRHVIEKVTVVFVDA